MKKIASPPEIPPHQRVRHFPALQHRLRRIRRVQQIHLSLSDSVLGEMDSNFPFRV